ncbi:polysaccharide lyase [Bradyrhizobium iriomotense]|uniref:polysaccharide lyase n=1 Tax=Bradyrhizobium iriomotense TaxID=441950 RepID=UPI001B8A69E0|nr:polysaccharide lyase [Bradyrhizobium iriomotense]MBR1132223.1 polysaccharide lyase [Bradyrhizobium iriomotense]
MAGLSKLPVGHNNASNQRRAVHEASRDRYEVRRIAKLAIAGVVLCVLIACGAEAAFLFSSIFMAGRIPMYDEFATRDFSQWNGLAKQVCCSGSAIVVDAPNWKSKSAVKFEINFYEPLVKGSHRSEFRLKATVFHRPYEYGFKIFVPQDWQSDNNQVVVMQMHNVPDNWKGEWGLPPPLELGLVNDSWVLRTASGRTQTWLDRKGDLRHDTPWSQPFERGQWSTWIVRTRWSLDGDGMIEVEKDGKVVFQRNGANCYDNLLAPYFKFGAYAPAWRYLTVPPEPKTREVFFTDVFAREL